MLAEQLRMCRTPKFETAAEGALALQHTGLLYFSLSKPDLNFFLFFFPHADLARRYDIKPAWRARHAARGKKFKSIPGLPIPSIIGVGFRTEHGPD
jgi:hypothetical protein